MVNRKLIKVCGLRDDENIRQVAALGVDWIGMIFWDHSPRNVTMIPTHAGIIPDRGNLPTAPSEGNLPPAPSEGRGSCCIHEKVMCCLLVVCKAIMHFVSDSLWHYVCNIPRINGLVYICLY